MLMSASGRTVAPPLADVCAFGTVLAVAPSASAIVGGTPVGDGRRPFVVQIEQQDADGKWSHLCGGALVDKRVVATAAHCSNAAEQGKAKIRLVLGRADASKPGATVVKSDKFSIYSHPSSAP